MISLQNVIVYIGFCFSVTINVFLLYMIRKKTTKQLGTYKHLMQSFSILELCFSTIDLLNQPTIYVGGGSLMVFSTNPLHLPLPVAKHLNILNFTFSGMIISLLAIHFIYRYLAVCRTTWLMVFDKPYIFAWIGGYFGFAFEWYTASYFLGDAEQSCSFDIDHINPLDISVLVGVIYSYRPAPGSPLILCWQSIIYALILLKIVVLSGIIVIYCGWMTYKVMSKKRTTSRRTNEMQRQLFKALVFQTLIPTILLYVPLFIMFIVPIFGWTISRVAILLLSLFVLYPILDPLVVLYLFRDYRKAIKTMFHDKLSQPLLKFLFPSPALEAAQSPYIVQVQQANTIFY